MTTTVTTTVTTTTILTFGAALSLLLTIALIAFLVIKEVTSAYKGENFVRWGRALNVGIFPLLVSFLCIVGVKVVSAG
jgi:hypothetical protein